MPRYYCDYCDTYLTHDSPSVRKQHNSGYKHKANIRAYYQKFEEQQTQILIDQKIKEHLGQTVMNQQIGAAYNQHLASFPGGLPRLPVMMRPILPIPGGHHLAPSMTPPLGMPVPIPSDSGYATAPGMPMQPSLPPPPPPNTNVHPQVPGAGLPPTPSSSGVPTNATQIYSVDPNAPATGGGYSSYQQASQTSH